MTFAAIADPVRRRVRITCPPLLELKPSQARAIAFLLLNLADVATRTKKSTGTKKERRPHE